MILKDWKKETFIGKAADCGPGTGYYRIEFEGGEYDEFDDDDMQYFKLVKEHKKRKWSKLVRIHWLNDVVRAAYHYGSIQRVLGP